MNEIELLQYAIAQGIVDTSTIQAMVEMKERKKYLQEHKYRIWQGNNGYWYTELPATENTTRRLIKKKDQEDIHEEIINFYKTQEECLTIRSAFEGWMEEKMQWGEISKGTYDRYHTDFDRVFCDTKIPGTRVDIITEDLLEGIIKSMIIEKHLTVKSYGNVKTIIIGIFKYAKKKKQTQISISLFFQDLQISKKAFTPKQKKKQIFKKDEAAKIIQWLNEHPSVEHYGILLAFQTGMREGELASIKYSDIEGNHLHIQRQEISYKADEKGHRVRKVVDYTKSEAGDRYIVLTEKAQGYIKQLRKLNPFGEYIMQYGNRKYHTHTFNNRLYRACEECGIEKMSMHKIRKTYGTMLIDGGAKDSTVMDQMGHSDISTTRKFYYFNEQDHEEIEEQVLKAITIG